MPSKSGVYLFKNKRGKVIYVGKAKDIRKRVSSYFRKTLLDNKTLLLTSHIYSIQHIITTSEIEAFLLEANLIKKYKPEYNIRFLDDKSYPYIKISNIPFPYITIARRKDEKNATYFGRYTDATSVRVVLKLIRRIFPYQSVKNHAKRKCLYYHLGLCPCITVYPEKLEEYNRDIRKIKSFLTGKMDGVVRELEKERDKYVKLEAFEKASDVQKKIERILFITSPQYDPFYYEQDPNLYLKRINNEFDSLKTILLKYFPSIKFLKRIECFDISNIQGKNATGSMVVFKNGEMDKSQYRRFKIRTKNTPDDYRMMIEVLQRRMRKKEWEMPDLIVIDGGKGQVSAALCALDTNRKLIPLIGLAKREEIIIIPLIDDRTKQVSFVEVKLPLSSPGVNLLRRIRDEAHRFALSYHRLLRKKYLLNN